MGFSAQIRLARELLDRIERDPPKDRAKVTRVLAVVLAHLRNLGA